MKKIHTFILAFTLLLAFTACGDMLRSLRQESLDADQADADSLEEKDNSYVANRAKRLNGLSANNSNAIDPPVRRAYSRGLASADEAAARVAPKRYSREDFIDKNPAENSLWDAQGQNNYLFTNNRKREVGDLVTVDVDRELKREIQYSLWQTLPAEQRKIRKLASFADANDPTKKVGAAVDSAADKVAAAADAAKSAEEKGKDAAEEAAKTNIKSAGKEDDIVRMEVAEHVGNGLVRLVGTKRVIYRGISKTVEVVALVNNKDIDDNNRLKSNAFLDMQTQVVQ